MDIDAKINGKQVDVIECFENFILVQNIVTKEIFLASYGQFDSCESDSYTLKSNVISFEGWKSWEEKRKDQPRRNKSDLKVSTR